MPLEQMVPEMTKLDITCSLELKLHILVMNHMTEQVRCIINLVISVVEMQKLLKLFLRLVMDLFLV